MTHTLPTPLLQITNLHLGFQGQRILRDLQLDIRPGLTAIVGDEGTGKTALLRVLSGDLAPETGSIKGPQALWLDLRLPGHDEHTPIEVWASLQGRCPGWNHELQNRLAEALQLQEHLHKRLFMLSTGSRRKVGLLGLLASGATITCLDQPFASLDMASIQVLRDFLQEAAKHPARAWVVADYEADPRLPWCTVCKLA